MTMLLRHRMLTPAVVVSLTILAGREVCAQAITVQQPVVQQFGVQTVVSVPDRGAALLGSVSSAAEFRRRDGFGPLSTSIGRQIAHSSLSVHVMIHDFAAMDAALLSAADAIENRSRRPAHEAPLSGMAVRAREQLLRQHRHIPPTP
jgi:hypothetical protein